MSKRPRRNHSSSFNAKVALAAVEGEKTQAELAQQHLQSTANGISGRSDDHRRIDEVHLLYPFASSRMLRDLLRQEGTAVDLYVATLMKRKGLEALYRRPNTSKRLTGHKIYPDLLRKLVMTRPNQVWVTNITYISMARGFVYLAAIIDWSTRRVLAWRVSISLDVGCCIEALEDALVFYGKQDIFNSDQGSQFTSAAFTDVLHRG